MPYEIDGIYGRQQIGATYPPYTPLYDYYTLEEWTCSAATIAYDPSALEKICNLSVSCHACCLLTSSHV